MDPQLLRLIRTLIKKPVLTESEFTLKESLLAMLESWSRLQQQFLDLETKQYEEKQN